MDRKYYEPMDSYLTPEQIIHEENGREKIWELYNMSKIFKLGTFIGAGGVTFFALKHRRLAKVLVPPLTGGLTAIVADQYVTKVSVFFLMIFIKLI